MRSGGISGMCCFCFFIFFFLRSAGSSHLFSLTQHHNAGDSQNDLTRLFGMAVWKPWRHWRRPWHSLLINQSEVRSNGPQRSHGRVEERSGAGEFYWLLGLCNMGGKVYFLWLWLCFSFQLLREVVSDDKHAHTWVLPSLFKWRGFISPDAWL